MSRCRKQSERKPSIKRLLKSDPTICLIKTPQGVYRTHRHWFEQLCKLPWLVKVAPRVARVVDRYTATISQKEYYVYQSKRERITPTLPTFSQQVENAWIYKCESRSLSPAERIETATRNYALYCVLEAV